MTVPTGAWTLRDTPERNLAPVWSVPLVVWHVLPSVPRDLTLVPPLRDILTDVNSVPISPALLYLSGTKELTPQAPLLTE